MTVLISSLKAAELEHLEPRSPGHLSRPRMLGGFSAEHPLDAKSVAVSILFVIDFAGRFFKREIPLKDKDKEEPLNNRSQWIF